MYTFSNLIFKVGFRSASGHYQSLDETEFLVCGGMCSSVSRNICYQILQENKDIFTLADNISLYEPTKSTTTSFAQISDGIVYHYENTARKVSNIPGVHDKLPNLPISWDSHCMVSLENGNLFVMNGREVETNDLKLDTYYYDFGSNVSF